MIKLTKTTRDNESTYKWITPNGTVYLFYRAVSMPGKWVYRRAGDFVGSIGFASLSDAKRDLAQLFIEQ